jgi:TrmH family RNA methyltransferase
MRRHPDLTAGADEISEKDATALSETTTPQGLVAVCRIPAVGLADVLARGPRLLAALVDPNDPGNLGTVVRTADAAGADAVVLHGGVDPYNGKVVRASAGSLFHLPVVQCPANELLAATAAAGLTSLATSGAGGRDLDDLIDEGALAVPTVWLFGTEAHGLPDDVLAASDQRVCIPIHGRAESLNLAAAAAVCLYASARAQRRSG